MFEMAMLVRIAKIMMVAFLALLMLLISVNNILDYGTNFEFVKHVLSMDTISNDTKVSWRSVSSGALQHIAYVLIITWESLSAITCAAGAVKCYRARQKPAVEFDKSKNLALCGLVMSVSLWLVGFLTVGGEWFVMWHSTAWNGQTAAMRMLEITLLFLIFLIQPDGDVVDE